MNIRKPLIGFGVFAIVSVLVTVTIWNTLARSVSGSTTSYSATFSDVLGLRPGDDVRMAGVRVGKVDKIDLDKQHHAVVTFIVQSDQTLYGTTKALVRYQNLIGQRYVALAPGTKGVAAPLHDGGSIPLAQTEPSFDISGLLNGFEPLFQTLQPEQVNQLSNTFIQALQGDGVSLSAFITQAAALAGDFQRRDAILSDVITNLSGVMAGLAKRGDELETLVTQTRALIGGLYQQGQSLQTSTVKIADATTAMVKMLGGVQPKIAAAQNASTSALTMLIGNGAKLDQAAIDLPNIMSDVGKFTQDGAYASAYVCTLDISLYGVLLPRGLLNQIGGPSHSAVCRP
ncbi:MCE family protein [Nocardia sp. CA2R105]|uniref:MCE family protein n=1 Tax=Nocardia coffeae TaxID=2873381 RepID=UPI001CA613E8|nr:MCE family protein [Nocardia coffeae]MBY8858876.1 MCE family protein [Nocardia coffeae]